MNVNMEFIENDNNFDMEFQDSRNSFKTEFAGTQTINGKSAVDYLTVVDGMLCIKYVEVE